MSDMEERTCEAQAAVVNNINMDLVSVGDSVPSTSTNTDIVN